MGGLPLNMLMQLPVAQTLDFLWYQALASVSALRTFRDPPAQWRSFSRRDAIPAWGRLYNRLHPGVDIYSVHFVKKMPWCQYFNGQGSRTDCQLPDGSEVSLAVMMPDSLGGSVKYIKGFAFEIRTSFPQELAAPKQAYVRNMQVVVSHEQRDYREPLISHAELVGEEGFTFVPELSSVKPPRHGVSMWHHVLGVHSDRIPSVLGVASGDAPRGYCLLALNMLGLPVIWNRPSTYLPAASGRLKARGGSALITWYGPSSPQPHGRPW